MPTTEIDEYAYRDACLIIKHTKETQMTTIDELMATKRFAFYIPPDGYVQGQGFRVSVVFENTPGHFPTGNWPYNGSPEQKVPWFWGHDLEAAKQTCDAQNERMGVSPVEALKIITSSMAAGHRGKGRPRGSRASGTR
jgi:hypothetical protein